LVAVNKNLLRSRGFCMTPMERLPVYPYMANRSVASCLRGKSSASFFLIVSKGSHEACKPLKCISDVFTLLPLILRSQGIFNELKFNILSLVLYIFQHVLRFLLFSLFTPFFGNRGSPFHSF
jgi:hypothetical protein